jgi:hypothetical protein
VATISHDPLTRAEHKRLWIAVFSMSELWASLAIMVIWLAVLFAVVYAPDIVTRSAGGDNSTIPSGTFVALFATIATWPIAKYGFRRQSRDA